MNRITSLSGNVYLFKWSIDTTNTRLDVCLDCWDLKLAVFMRSEGHEEQTHKAHCYRYMYNVVNTQYNQQTHKAHCYRCMYNVVNTQYNQQTTKEPNNLNIPFTKQNITPQNVIKSI